MACCIVPMYAMGSIAWLPAIAKGKQLAVYGSMWNILSFLMTLFVGLVIFKEQLTTTQIAGCILAGVAIILLSI